MLLKVPAIRKLIRPVRCILAWILIFTCLMLPFLGSEDVLAKEVTQATGNFENLSLTLYEAPSYEDFKAYLNTLYANLAVQVDGSDTTIRVKWNSEDYDPQTAGAYTFYASMNSRHDLAENVSLPEIMVTLEPNLILQFDTSDAETEVIEMKTAEEISALLPAKVQAVIDLRTQEEIAENAEETTGETFTDTQEDFFEAETEETGTDDEESSDKSDLYVWVEDCYLTEDRSELLEDYAVVSLTVLSWTCEDFAYGVEGTYLFTADFGEDFSACYLTGEELQLPQISVTVCLYNGSDDVEGETSTVDEFFHTISSTVSAASNQAYQSVIADETSAAAQTTASGTTGSCDWYIQDGILYIEPSDGVSGTLGIYSDSDWQAVYDYVDSITGIEIEAGVTAGSDFSYFFYAFTGITYIKTADDFDVSGVIYIQNLFNYCYALQDISSLAGWNITNRLYTMSAMFSYCYCLTDISALANWDVSGVTSISYAFEYTPISDLTVLSGWELSAVRTMEGTFKACTQLTTLDGLDNWYISGVTDLGALLYGCTNLTDISALKNWDTSMNINLSYLLYNCEKLADIGALSGWKTAKVTAMHCMLYGCTSLTDISALAGWETGTNKYLWGTFSFTAITDVDALANWDTSAVTEAYHAFSYCDELADLDGLAGWDVTSLMNVSYMFAYDSSLTDIKGLTKWETSSLIYMNSMFNRCSSLSDVSPLAGWDTSDVQTLSNTFIYCTALSKIDFSGWDTGSLTNMSYTFGYCESLTDISTLSGWDTSLVTTMGAAFLNCEGIEDFSAFQNWSTSSLTSIFKMFEGTQVSSDDLYDFMNWDVSLVENASYLFAECLNLTNLDALAGWELSANKYFNSMFLDDTNLTDITGIADWDIGSVHYLSGMFQNCTALTQADLSAWVNGEDLLSLRRMFSGCTALETIDLSGLDTSLMAYSYQASEHDYEDIVDNSRSEMFLNCVALQSVTFGTGWTWGSAYSTEETGSLPDAGGRYSMWIRTNDMGSTYGMMTAADLAASWDSSYAGTWIWAGSSGHAYVSADNYYDPQMTYYDGEGNALDIESGADLYPASEGYTGYWTKVLDDVWVYTFYLDGDDDGTEYYLYEDDLDGYATAYEELTEYKLSNGNTVDAYFSDDINEQATITNTSDDMDYGSLSITKQVTDFEGNGLDTAETFSVQITLYDENGDLLTGTHRYTMSVISGGVSTTGILVFREGSAMLTVGNDVTVVISNIPEGYHFTVCETDSGDFTAAYTDSDGNTGTQQGLSGNIVADDADGNVQTAAVTITNRIDELPVYGSLQIVKQITCVNNTDFTAEDTFVITVTLCDEDGESPDGIQSYRASGAYTNVTFTNGTAFVVLGDDDYVIIEDIPAAYGYTVTEADSGDYIVSYTNRTGTISKDVTAYVCIDNRIDEEAAYGSLKVTKEVTYTDGTDYDDENTFPVTISLYDETDALCDGTMHFTAEGAEQTVTFVNGTAQVVLGDDAYILITGIPAGYSYYVEENGTYYADEEGTSAYTVSYDSAQKGTITADTTAQTTVTNTVDDERTGTLRVLKQLSDLSKTRISEWDESFPILITVTDPDTGEGICGTYAAAGTCSQVTFVNGQTTIWLSAEEYVDIYDLPAGYTATAAEPDLDLTRYIQAYTYDDGADCVSTEIQADERRTLIVENYYLAEETGSLMIEKMTLDTDGNVFISAAAFTVKVTLTDADAEPLSGITYYGDYLFVNGVCLIAISAGETITIEEIPAGYQYTVVETDDGGYSAAYADSDGHTGTDSISGTILTDDMNGNRQTSIVTIINTQKEDAPGVLAITKEVTYTDGTDFECADEFYITISIMDDDTVLADGLYGEYLFTDGKATIMITDGETVRITGLPAGCRYEIEEIPCGDYIPVYDAHASGTIASDTVSLTTVTNTIDDIACGGLQIIKSAVLSDGTEFTSEDTFVVTVVLLDDEKNAVDAVFGDYTFVDGMCEIALLDDDAVTIENIPEGYIYSIEETQTGDITDFTPVYQNAEGTIQANTTAIVSIINETDDVTLYGELSVTKRVTYADGTDVRNSDSFTVTVTLTDVQGKTLEDILVCGDYIFIDGVTQFAITDDETVLIENIPAGYAYLVEEAGDAEEYETTYEGEQKGVIYADKTTEIIIMNMVYDEPVSESVQLTVAKQTDGWYDGTDDTVYTLYVFFENLNFKEEYAVSYTDADGYECKARTGSDEILASDADGDATAVILLTDKESATIYGLPEGTVYTAVETAGDYISSYTITDAANKNSIVSAAGSNAYTDTELRTQQETADAGEDVTITFTNIITKTEDVQLTKASTTGTDAADTNDETKYCVTAVFTGLIPKQDYNVSSSLNEEGIAAWQLIADTDGYAEIVLTITNGETLTFEGLPVGCTYTFTETGTEFKTASYVITDASDLAGSAVVCAADTASAESADLSTQTERVDAGEEITVTFTNKSTSVSLQVVKKDSDGVSLLGGAVFSLYMVTEEGAQLIADDITTSTEQTDAYGYSQVITGLHAGTYYLEETLAPDGYYINENMVTFTLTEEDYGSVKVMIATNHLLSILVSTGGIGICGFIGVSILTAGGIAVYSCCRRRKRRKG